jgi:hypothetical protein
MKKSGEHIRVNFGQSPFVFDIDGMMAASYIPLILNPPRDRNSPRLYLFRTRGPTPDPPDQHGVQPEQVRDQSTWTNFETQNEKQQIRQQIETTESATHSHP